MPALFLVKLATREACVETVLEISGEDSPYMKEDAISVVAVVVLLAFVSWSVYRTLNPARRDIECIARDSRGKLLPR